MANNENIDVNAMSEDALRALCSKLLEDVARAETRAGLSDERLAELYHPDFGSEWQDSGEIGRAILSAEAQGIEQAIRLIAPPEGANGDVAVALTIATRALREKAGALHQRARQSAQVAKLRFATKAQMSN